MKKYGFKASKVAISTAAVAVIVVVIVVIAGVGAYVALNAGKTTTSSSTSATTFPTSTTSSNPATSSSSSLPSTSTSSSTAVSSTTSNVCTSATSTVGTTVTGGTTLTTSLPTITVNEAGSSLLYPLWEAWKVNFSAAYPSVTLNVAAGGSGLGQQGVEDGTLQLGASDAYATAAQLSVYPCILNIPVAISAQQIMYNLPGLSPRVHLNFSGPVLAGIYNGSITAWSSPQITSLQTNASVVSYLNSVPSTDTIIPIVRSDSSGDSFIFTEYLSVTTPSWNGTTHYSTLPSWPTNPAEKKAMGNSGMVSTCNTTSYSLAYIGVSYLNKATVDNPTPLGYAYLKNQAGNYVNISTTNINAAVTAMASSTPQNEIQSLIFAPGSDSYPIVNFEYIWVANYQTTPGTAAALRTLLTWCIIPTEGNAAFYLGPVNFVPLPTTVEELSLNQIAQISGP